MANGEIAGVIAVTGQTANALKVIGAIVFVEPEEFLAVLEKSEKHIVVYSPSGFLSKHKYLTNYKGFTFFTKSKEALTISCPVEVITAKNIIIPEM
ncbi:MAG: hypothetical protein WAK60_05540 [Sedimentisphaerales bacterium]